MVEGVEWEDLGRGGLGLYRDVYDIKADKNMLVLFFYSWRLQIFVLTFLPFRTSPWRPSGCERGSCLATSWQAEAAPKHPQSTPIPKLTALGRLNPDPYISSDLIG